MPNLDEIHNTFNNKLKISEHYTWYLQGLLNAMMPPFANQLKTKLTNDDVSGEYLEAMRIVANRYASDLEEGEKVSLGYAAVRRALGEKNDYYQTFEVDSMADTINYTLGKFDIIKRDGKLVVNNDPYDFPPELENKYMKEKGRLPTSVDYMREAISLSMNEDMEVGEKIHRIAHLGGELFMPQGDEDNLVAELEIPDKLMVIETAFDNEYSDEAPVFRGAMTRKRKDIFDSFVGLFIGDANAEEMADAPAVPRPRPEMEVPLPAPRPDAEQVAMANQEVDVPTDEQASSMRFG